MTEPLTLVRSTPVRQALILVAVFSFVNLLTLGGAYLKLRTDLLATIETRVAGEIAGLDVSATPGALATLVRARAQAADPAKTVYAFRGSDGRMAGNAMVLIDGADVRLVATEPDKPLGESGYLHRIRRLSGGVLVVAESLDPVEDLRHTFVSLLALGLVPTIVLSLGLGVLIARRSARRVERIEATLGRLAAGDLAARLADPGGEGDDLSRIGQGVNRMAVKQEAATEAIRQVSADIAHDLRTPLQRISVLLGDLHNHVPETGRAAELAAQAEAESARAVAVFQSLLHIAQIEGGQPRQSFGSVDLAAVARQIGDLYLPAAEDDGRALTMDLPPGPVAIRGDGDLIGQAIANLLENALRHTPSGTPVTLAVRQTSAGATVTVGDRGPGIPASERKNVLKRLYRLESSRTTPGNGLGLSLAAAVAAAHDAELTLEDNAPGLRATLCFPAASETRPEAA